MSIPTQPTTTTISTEAYQLYARRNPTASEITRVSSYGMEMIKDDLMNKGVAWDFLRTTAYQPITAGKSSYQAPTDYRKIISVRLMDGTRRGTAQTGTSGSITLASTDAGSSGDTVGKWILLTGGTGSGQCLQCTSFNASTHAAIMETSWTTTPDFTTTYLVVDLFKDVKVHTIYDRDQVRNPSTPGTPENIFHIADSAEGDLVTEVTPDNTYGLEIVYYADLLKMDTDTAVNVRYARVLRLLNGLFIQGVYSWLCQNDSRYVAQRQLYEQKLNQVSNQYLYPNNESSFTIRLDY